MIKIQLRDFSNYIKKTFLEFLSDAEIANLHEHLVQVDLDSYQKVPREEPPQYLYFVYAGEVQLKNRTTGQDFGSVARGQSLDFKSILLKFPQWQSDWSVKDTTVLLKIPYSKLEPILALYPEQLNYLSKLSQSVSIQRYKRDLLALGFNPIFIKELILKFKLCSLKEFREAEQAHLLILGVLWGEVEIISRNDHEKNLNRTLKTGDTCIIDVSNSKIDLVAPTETRLFVLPKEEIEFFKDNIEFNKLIRMNTDYQNLLTQQNSFNSSVSEEHYEKQELQLSQERLNKYEIVKAGSGNKAVGPIAKVSFLRQDDIRVATEMNRSHSYIIEILLQRFDSGMTLGDLDFKDDFPFHDTSILDFKEKLAAAQFITEIKDFASVSEFPLHTFLIASTYRGFALLKRVGADEIEFYDLDKGSVVKVKSDFIETRLKSTSYILISKWNGQKKKAKSRFNIGVCWDLVKDKKRLLALSLIVSFISYVMSLSFPIITQYLTDQVVQYGRADSLPLLTCLLILVTLYSVFIDWYGQRLTSYFTNLLTYRLKSLFNSNLLERNSSIPKEVYITRISEVESLSNYYFAQYIPATLNCFLALITLGVISLYSKLIGLILTCSLPLTFIVIYYFRGKIIHVKGDYLKSKTNENQTLIQLFTNSESLKLLKTQLISRWKMELVQNMTVQYLNKNTFLQSMLQILQLFKSEAIRIVTIVISLKLYVNDELTLGQVLALTMLAPRLGGQLQIVINAFFQFFAMRTLCEKLDELYVPKNNIETQKPAPFSKAAPADFAVQKDSPAMTELVVENLSYSYFPNELNSTLQNLNFTLAAGEVLAVTGETGSGKSTLAYLLAGAYKPKTGTLQFKSTAQDIPFEDVKISLVEQDGRLFIGSILYNITLDDANPDVKRATEVIQLLDFEDEIMQKSNGISSLVQGQGSGLSPSLKSKILIARAIYQKPDILILDETTCFFDPMTEIEFLKKIKTYMKDGITILITSKISIAMKCDKIISLKDGKIEQQGTHRDLVNGRGEYFDLLYRQVIIK